MIGVRAYVALTAWAGLFVLQALLPMKLIAEIVFAFCIGAAMHAALISAGVWLFSRECVRVDQIGRRGGRRLYWLAVVAVGVWYLVAAIHDGRRPLNVAAIEGAYVAGVFLYERRAAVEGELRRRIRVMRAGGGAEASE